MAAEANLKTVQVEEEIEGERIETEDYFFDKIGEAVPLLSDGSAFDTQNLPGKPLAVAECLGLIFAAHTSGFCVAKTKDLIASAKEIKDKGNGPSVQESSVIDVPVGRVHILALSTDSSVLAAVVGRDIHCFSVNSLLQKDKKPILSCSVESDHVKDLLWTKDVEASFVVLAGNGKLLTGALHKSLKEVMEEVDAVGTSFDGNFVAVARKSTLSIYSSKFNEIFHISLPLSTWMGDSATSDTVKVDAIRWVRSDSIVVGCLRLTEAGEENYFLQVIKSKNNKTVDGSSTLAAVNFSDIFAGIIDDIVPFGCGPYLFMDYLENCELAFVANRKNTDQHIMLFLWAEGEGQVCVVDIERERWVPRIELQENGDENLVLGLCIDKTCVYGNVIVKLGEEDQRELPPHCLLICLTLEGKLIMFNVASIAGARGSTMASSGLSSDAQHIPVVGPSNLTEAPSTSEEESAKKSAMTSGSDELNAKKFSFGFDGNSARKDTKPDVKNYFISTPDYDENQRKESVSEISKEEALVDGETCKDGQLGQSSRATLSLFSLKDSPVGSLSSVAGDIGAVDFGKSIAKKTGSVVAQSSPIALDSTSSGAISSVSSGKSPFASPSGTRSALSGSGLTSVDTSNNARSFIGNLSSRPSDMFSSSIGKAANHRQKALTSGGFTDTQLGVSTSQMQSQEIVALQNPIGNTRFTMKGSNVKSFPFGQLNSEQESSKQYCNVQNMASELDKLLACIEEAGGFIYACTTAHRSLLETLEEGLKCISERSRVWQSFTEERLREVQLLLDKTVQVLAREKHMEGIVRQTTDEQYWDLWNRQKLSSELDLKRQNVLNRSQDLINQMIELEKHFNALELNLFGESSAEDMLSQALRCRSTSSRNIQSLHAVYSATISQLSAAEHLSDLLLQQMDVLSIKSPPTKQENRRKQLFESIGISDSIDYVGPASTGRMVEPSSNKKPLVSSSGAARTESRRNLLSSLGGHEPETARRRRDSLDRNWVKFETPRTTVKRMLVDNESHNVSSSFSSRGNQFVSPGKLEGSMARYPKFLAMEDSNGRKDAAIKHNSEIAAAPMFQWAGTISAMSQAEAQRTPSLQASQGNSFSAIPNKFASSSPLSSFSAPFVNPNVADDNGRSTAEGAEVQIGHVNKSEPAFIEQSKPSGHPLVQEKLNTQKMQQLLSSPAEGGDVSVSFLADTPLTATVGGRSPLMGSVHEAKLSPLSGSSPFSTYRSAFMVTAPDRASSIASLEGGALSSANMVKDVNDQVIQPLSSASSVSSLVAYAKSKDSSTVASQSTGSFMSSSSEPVKTGLKPPAEEASAGTNIASTQKLEPSPSAGLKPSQKLEPSPSDALKFQFSTSSKPATEVPRQEASGSPLAVSGTATFASDGSKFQFSTSSKPASEVPGQEASGSPLAVSRTATLASDLIQNAQSEKATVESRTLPLSLSDPGFTTSGKSVVDAPLSHEEEMEEEAPETNETANLSLGSLAGFGIGSLPSATTSRSNPFGAPVTSTPVSLTVPSGELFRPASLSFQSLQPFQPSQPSNVGANNGAFGSGNPFQQPSSGSGFGQHGQIGSGQAALGSVLGSFGQSRQLGTGFGSGGFGGTQTASGFLNASTGGGFAGASATGGFAGASATGGFAAAATSAGGFAGGGGGFVRAAAPGGGFATAAGGSGFAGAAATGGGFAAAAGGSGFAGAAATAGGFGGAATMGAGFGAFSKQGTGGFSSVGPGIGVGARPASDLFTQMRK